MRPKNRSINYVIFNKETLKNTGSFFEIGLSNQNKMEIFLMLSSMDLIPKFNVIFFFLNYIVIVLCEIQKLCILKL